MITNNKILLSVVIVNYNTTHLTLACLSSIDKYHPRVNFEVILVDNGSQKESLDKIKNARFKSFKLNILYNEKNLGFSKANNQGIGASSGEYVLLLNSDTEVKKGSIDALLNFAKHKSDVGVVGSRLLNSDGSVQASAFKFPTINKAIRQHWLGEKNLLDKYVPSDKNPVETEVLVMASLLITPKALKNVGLLDERYFIFFEDMDYCRRVLRAGLKVYYLPDSVVVHHHGASGKNLVDKLNQWRRLTPSSKIYHGLVGHYIYNFIIWSQQKLLVLVCILISIMITPWFRQYRLSQNLFQTNITQDIQEARGQVDWERGKISHSSLNSLFLNWPKVIFNERMGIVMESLDIGNYFFAGHPRERVGIIETQKFLPIQFVIFVIGLTSDRFRKYKLHLIVYSVAVLIFTFIFKWRTFEETILMSVPIVIVIAFGFEKILFFVKMIFRKIKLNSI